MKTKTLKKGHLNSVSTAQQCNRGLELVLEIIHTIALNAMTVDETSVQFIHIKMQ